MAAATRVMVPFVLAVLLMAGAVGAAGPDASVGPLAARDDCRERHPALGVDWVASCGFAASATLTVHGCVADRCSFTVSADLRSASNVTGLHGLSATLLAEEYDGFCMDPRELSDPQPPYAGCASLCEAEGLGMEASCSGQRAGSVHVAPGSCGYLYVGAQLDFSGIEEALTLTGFALCRDAAGALLVGGAVMVGESG